MNWLQSFKMAFKSIMSKKGRSALTMLGIIIGIASVMTIVSVVNGYNKQTMERINSMGTNRVSVYAYRQDNKNIFDGLYDYCLGMSDIIDGITPSASIWTQGGVRYGSRSSTNMEYAPQLYLGSDQYSACNNFVIEYGRDISKVDIVNYNNVCVLGARAAKLFFDYLNPLGESLSVNGVAFKVVGVYKEKDPDSDWSLDNVIVFPYTASRAINNQDIGSLSEFIIKGKDKKSLTEIVSRVDGYLSTVIPEGTGYYSVYNEGQWQDQSNEFAKTMSLVLGGIGFISLLVGGIGIMNIMLVTVTERTREIGIRRAIGAPRSAIVSQFLVEAAMICGIGGIFGIIVGFAGTLIAGKLIVNMILIPGVGVTAAAFVFSVVLGIIFGMYPAIKASALLPVVALRAE
ncbi:MAG: ABC transporter permease [Clostridia bacterium]|nr:ABC transporter permease [Clostridia bacterium]